MNWTADKDEMLRIRIGDNVPFRDIAAELGTSRSAAIGRANRIGLSNPGVKCAPKPKPAPRKQKPKPPKPPVDVDELVLETEPLPVEETAPFTAIGIEDMTSKTCRWPYGDPKTGVLYCGGLSDNLGGKPYCEAHTKRAKGKIVMHRRRRVGRFGGSPAAFETVP